MVGYSARYIKPLMILRLSCFRLQQLARLPLPEPVYAVRQSLPGRECHPAKDGRSNLWHVLAH